MKVTRLVSLALSLPLAVFAHGEDRFGPHGGFIRMPGGFHTEIKLNEKELLVYLLDINWKDPVTQKSSVEVEYIWKAQSPKLQCITKEKYFSCSLPTNFNTEIGKLIVVADRMGMKGAKAEYDLPLKLVKKEMEHGNH